MPPKKPVAPKPAVKAPTKAVAPRVPAGRGGQAAAAKKGVVASGVGAKKGAPAAKNKGDAVPQKPKAKKKKDKEDYEELMDKLEKEAFVKLVKMEQEQAEKERKKEEEERRRKKEERMRKKRILEAAFDGDNDAILTILKEVSELDDKNGIGNDVIGSTVRKNHLLSIVNCEDANENTPISEAGSGGHAQTIRLLLEKGADPNSQGQFLRTPLYRAAFAGHLEACEELLKNGADPRIYASDSQNPEQIASLASVVELLKSWDITQTDTLLEKLEREKETRREENRKRMEAEESKLEEQLKVAQKEYGTKQKQLEVAYKELNKRIFEHDMAATEGFERPEITLQAIHDAEDELEILKLDTEKARDKLSQAKLRLREQQKGNQESLGEEELPGLKVLVRELDEVLIRDVGNKIKDSGKWPLLIDPNAQAATFLRYRDTNYINALSPADMEPEKIRMAALGAVRFGKPLILDMMEVDMFETCSDRFDEVFPGFMNSIMDKTIMKEENYSKLIKKTDGTEYNLTLFSEARTDNFKFVIITKNSYPPDDLMENCYIIRMFIPT
ncbi:hypothetical protein ScPMuIL_006891 [Solemya velum]